MGEVSEVKVHRASTRSQPLRIAKSGPLLGARLKEVFRGGGSTRGLFSDVQRLTPQHRIEKRKFYDKSYNKTNSKSVFLLAFIVWMLSSARKEW